jgi:hypothetical protein
MPNIFSPVWFVANYLAAYHAPLFSFTDSCQNFGNPWAAESCWLANFGRAPEGTNQIGSQSWAAGRIVFRNRATDEPNAKPPGAILAAVQRA